MSQAKVKITDGGVYSLRSVKGSLYKVSGIYPNRDRPRAKMVATGEYTAKAPEPWFMAFISDLEEWLVAVNA